MFLKIIVLTILITSSFEKIKTEKFPHQESELWDSSGESEGTKEFSSKDLLVKDNKEEMETKDEDVTMSMSEEFLEYNGNYKKKTQLPNLATRGNNIPIKLSDAKNRSNVDETVRSSSFLDKFKRQITVQQIVNGNNNPDNSFDDLSLSLSEESRESNSSEIFSDKFKRHIPIVESHSGNTDIKGNSNRFLCLLNLPVKLNVLANVLSVLNQEVVGTEGNTTDAGDFSITGNNKRVLNLVDLPVDVKALLNILSTVNQTGDSNTGGSKEGNTNQPKLLAGLLGGEEGNGNLLEDLLGRDKNNGLVKSLLGDGLGHTLEDLLAGLLENDAELGGILGSDQESGFLGPLLENLLEAVGSIVENLLELLIALLEALLKSLSHTALKENLSGATANLTQNINTPMGNNNQVLSLINAPIKIQAFINILNSLKRQIAQQTNPNITTNSLLEEGASISELTDDDTLIQGNNNSAANLLNLPPDANFSLNHLRVVTQLLNPLSITSTPPTIPTTTAVTATTNPNEICFDIPIDQSDSAIINTNPKLHLVLNLLSQINQSGSSLPLKVHSQRICIPLPSTPTPTTVATTTTTTVKPTTTTTPAPYLPTTEIPCFKSVYSKWLPKAVYIPGFPVFFPIPQFRQFYAGFLGFF